MSTVTHLAQSETLWWYTSVAGVCCYRRRRTVMGPWCAALYDRMMAPLERGRFQAIRKQLLRQARGKVVEIGSGTGVNFPYYTAAEHVIALDPDPFMVARSLP